MNEIEPDFLDNFEAAYFQGAHEVHITVANDTDVKRFEDISRAVGVDPQIIYNEIPNGETMVDLLTVSHYDFTSMAAYMEIGRIADAFTAMDLTVVRQKIETTATHPYAPSRRNPAPKPGTYFESHMVVDAPTDQLMELHLQGPGAPVYLSTSDNKRRNGQSFATYRRYDVTAQDFYSEANAVYDELHRIARVGRLTTEFALYDSNPDHDRAWTSAYHTN